MAVSTTGYGLFHQSILEGRVNLDSDPVFMMLCNSSYVPNTDTHKFRSVVTNEIVGSGYTAGGQQVSGITKDYASKKLTINGGPMNWPTVTWSDARYGVVYVAPIDIPITQQPLVCFVDFGVGQNITDGPFYVTWPSTGIITMAWPS
jgi:hypothetical protein